MWTMNGLAIVLSIGRYVIRFKSSNALGLSDAFHLVSLLLLIAFSIVETKYFGFIVAVSFPTTGAPSNTDFIKWLKIIATTSFCWFVGIYCIKFSFLFFYRTLFKIDKTFRKVWWIIFTFLILFFGASVGAVFSWCDGKASEAFSPGMIPSLLLL